MLLLLMGQLSQSLSIMSLRLGFIVLVFSFGVLQTLNSSSIVLFLG